jgi:hypothetical protein
VFFYSLAKIYIKQKPWQIVSFINIKIYVKKIRRKSIVPLRQSHADLAIIKIENFFYSKSEFILTASSKMGIRFTRLQPKLSPILI